MVVDDAFVTKCIYGGWPSCGLDATEREQIESMAIPLADRIADVVSSSSEGQEVCTYVNTLMGETTARSMIGSDLIQKSESSTWIHDQVDKHFDRFFQRLHSNPPLPAKDRQMLRKSILKKRTGCYYLFAACLKRWNEQLQIDTRIFPFTLTEAELTQWIGSAGRTPISSGAPYVKQLFWLASWVLVCTQHRCIDNDEAVIRAFIVLVERTRHHPMITLLLLSLLNVSWSFGWTPATELMDMRCFRWTWRRALYCLQYRSSSSVFPEKK